MSCPTRCCRKPSLIFALLVMAILATPAFAGNCLKDVSKANSCSANDVSIAAVKNGTVNVYSGGIPGTNQCIEHGQFSFTAEFEVKTTSSSTRSNIGIFFGTGQNSALSGTCTNQILAPTHPCAFVNGVSTATCGDANYKENDQGINGEPGIEATQASCGDTSSNDSSTDFGPGTHQATLEVLNVTCPAATSACPAGSGITGPCLQLPVCSSWYQPANGMPVCESPAAQSYPWVPAAIPGSPSKCTCGTIFVPVTPVTVAPKVAKACNTTLTGTSPSFDFSSTTGAGTPNNCDAGAEGSTATYTVAIKSTATLSGNNTVVDQICDDQYGTIYSAFNPATCPLGKSGITATNVSCPPGGSTGIGPGATETCTFTAPVGENVAGLTDTVSASGHSSLNSSSTFTNTQSNSVTVTSSDAPSTATTTKSVDSLAHGCATVRYAVAVHNSSGPDEALTLSALQDSSFGDITKATPTNASVLGTTCGVASGVGTLSSSTGAGALPTTLAVSGADYSCKFDAQICGNLTTITLPPPGGTCLGFQHQNKVTPTLAGDEGEAVTNVGNTLTENVCFTHLEGSTVP
jgi:hypothetical protein